MDGVRHRKVLCATYIEASTESYCALVLIEGYPKAIECICNRREDLGQAVETAIFERIGRDFDFHIIALYMLDRPDARAVLDTIRLVSNEIAWFENAAA